MIGRAADATGEGSALVLVPPDEETVPPSRMGWTALTVDAESLRPLDPHLLSLFNINTPRDYARAREIVACQRFSALSANTRQARRA